MTQRINKNYNSQLNSNARVLFEEYNIAFKNKMWATTIILSLTIIDNILNDTDNLHYVDGLDINHFKSSKDFYWLRNRRNQILHFEKPVEGFLGNKDSDKTLVSGLFTIVCFDYVEQKTIVVPDIIKNQLNPLVN